MSAIAKLTKRKFVVVHMDLVFFTTVRTNEFPMMPTMRMAKFRKEKMKSILNEATVLTETRFNCSTKQRFSLRLTHKLERFYNYYISVHVAGVISQIYSCNYLLVNQVADLVNET